MHNTKSLLKHADLGQAIIRFFLSLGVLCYTGWFEYQPDNQSDPLLFQVAIGFFLFATINLISFWVVEVPLLLRRSVCIFVDTGIVTFSMAVFGEPATPFFGGYLWVTIANGLRFGRGYLYVTWILSVLGFIFVLLVSPYWQEQTTIGFGILLWMILLPLYFSKLLGSLENVVEREKKANSIKSEFMANMSHELRTPLNAIIGYSEMLMEDAEESGEKEQYDDLGKVHHAAHLLLNLINGVLDLSKIESGMMDVYVEDININNLALEVGELIRPQVEKNNSALSVKLDESIGSIKTDYTKIKQVVLNLLSNAAKFTHDGKIKLETIMVDSGKTPYIEIQVVDTGIGMDEQSLDRLFEPFTQADTSTTRKYGGTGLGLTITKGFVKMLHGELTVQSSLGEGTLFTVFLPCDFSSLKNREKYKGIAKEKRFGMGHEGDQKRKKISKILVVGPDPNMQDLLFRNLSETGFDVDVVSTEQQALKSLHDALPDVVIVDVVYHDIDSLSLLKSIKHAVASGDIPVVVLTMFDDVDLIRRESVCACVKKPVDFKYLEKTIVKCLRIKT